jgi:hypothetical protein
MTDVVLTALWPSNHYHGSLGMKPTYRWYQLTFDSVMTLEVLNIENGGQ